MADLNEKDLTTLQHVADELGITVGDDDTTDRLLKRYIKQASQRFAKATGRQFYNKSDHEERVRGFDDPIIHVKDHLPIEEVTKIEYDDGQTKVEIPESHWIVQDKGQGAIRRVAGTWTFSGETYIGSREYPMVGTEKPLIVVTYSGGYVSPQQAEDDGSLERDLPYDIEDAVIGQVVQRYRQKDLDPTVSSETIGDASVSYNTGGAGEQSVHDRRWCAAVAAYKRGGMR